VLLVEDEPINQEVSKALLEDVGLCVDVAEDGLQALEMVGLVSYALVLMDVQMPKMGGIEATRAIRKIPGRESMPILSMTASVFDENRSQCLEAGMNDFISKPVKFDEIFLKLLRWL
jgi:two-component system, sensor histidine kinase and response regulator